MGLRRYPFILSVSLIFFISSVLIMFKFKRSIIFLSIFILVGVVVLWVKDIIFEGMCGYHNVYVLDGIKLGVLLFIFSEIIFFFRIFWFFFDTALAPMVEIGEI